MSKAGVDRSTSLPKIASGDSVRSKSRQPHISAAASGSRAVGRSPSPPKKSSTASGLGRNRGQQEQEQEPSQQHNARTPSPKQPVAATSGPTTEKRAASSSRRPRSVGPSDISTAAVMNEAAEAVPSEPTAQQADAQQQLALGSSIQRSSSQPPLASEKRFRILLYSVKPYDRSGFEAAARRLPAEFQTELLFDGRQLSPATATSAAGADAVCIFVNDNALADTLRELHRVGVRAVLLRCAGFDNVDLECAKELGISIMRVPRYSPAAVAEHSVALIMSLARRIPAAYNRVRQFNFSLDGLQGINIGSRVVGVVGTGAIGKIAAQIMGGFGSEILLYDPYPDNQWLGKLNAYAKASYTTLDDLLERSDIVTLYLPLTPQSERLINAERIAKMKRGVMIINTSRGKIIDTQAVIDGLLSGQIGNLGIDVYERESQYFFEDHSHELMADPLLGRLVTFPNVIMTAHQAFLTEEAIQSISDVTMENARLASLGQCSGHPNECRK